jgi:hypothetical protein
MDRRRLALLIFLAVPSIGLGQSTVQFSDNFGNGVIDAPLTVGKYLQEEFGTAGSSPSMRCRASNPWPPRFGYWSRSSKIPSTPRDRGRSACACSVASGTTCGAASSARWSL